MRPGPAPKPTKLKKLAGNPGKRPLNEREPVVPVPAKVPYAPRHLNKEAKREWRRMAKVLIEAGLYSDVDRAALAMYCQAWGRWVKAEREIESSGGEVLQGKDDGGLYYNPWYGVANKAQEQIRRMIAEFGLSPAQRSRVVALQAADGDPTLADILKADFGVVKGKRAAGE